MSRTVRVRAWQRALLKSELPGSAKLVGFAIEHHVGKNTHAWPPLRLLADECSTSVSAIQRAIDALVEAKLVAIVRQGGKRSANHYAIALPANEFPVPSEGTQVVTQSALQGHSEYPPRARNVPQERINNGGAESAPPNDKEEREVPPSAVNWDRIVQGLTSVGVDRDHLEQHKERWLAWILHPDVVTWAKAHGCEKASQVLKRNGMKTIDAAEYFRDHLYT